MVRYEDFLSIQNSKFQKKVRNENGKILAGGITPLQYPVTVKSGIIYKIIFKYLCNVEGCRVYANIYKSPDEDYPHVNKVLELADDFIEEEMYVACPRVPYITDAHLRLWSTEPIKRTYIKDIKIESVTSVPENERRNIKKTRKIPITSSNYYKKRVDIKSVIDNKLNLMKLKTAPITFFSFVKNEGKYYLERMIKSILPYVNELVIVDTGSNDNTFDIIEKYKNVGNLKFISYPCSEKEIYKGINKGLKKIKNEWIFIIAGDEAMIKEDLIKIPSLLEEIQDTEIRSIRVSYHDFIGDDKHYHTRYHPTAFRIWRNIKGFHFGGDFQGDIYMGYNDGIQTGGVETKKNMPKKYIKERLDIYFHHYARCKPKNILLEKRIKYYNRRAPKGSTEREILKLARNDPFYTLKLPLKLYKGKQAGLDEKLRIGFYTDSPDYAHFARPILKQLTKEGHRVFQTFEKKSAIEICDKVDYMWIEWGEEWAKPILNRKNNCKIIIRIHRYEVDKHACKDIRWNNADILWFINREVRSNFRLKFPAIDTSMVYIPNAVDMGKLKFNDRDKYGKKICLYSTRFARIKDYPLAIEILDDLSKIDNDFSMLIRADIKYGNKSYEKCKQLSRGKNVSYQTSPIDFATLDNKSDINKLLRDTDIVLSTSRYESFHYSIPEALAKGCQVFVRGWDRGGRPEDFWNPYLYSSKKEMINAIIEWSKLSNDDKKEISKRNRRYVEKHFSVKRITKKLINVLKSGGSLPHVGIVMPVYNNEKYLEKSVKSLLKQSYKMITIVAVNDESTDNSLNILNKYKDSIVILNIKHGGAHHAMSEGLKFLKDYGIDYTIMAGSDDIYNETYVEDLVTEAEDNGAYFVYPNFNIIDENGNITDTYKAQRPKIEPLRNTTYFCDHSLVSADFWNWYGWELRVRKFKAYSIFHAYASIIKHFPDKVRWLNKVIWNYRVHPGCLHLRVKQERKGQRKKAVKDLFGD